MPSGGPDDRRRDPELVGHPAPRVGADQYTEGQPDDEPHPRDGARLPRDRRTDLTATEAERLQHRELVSTAAQRRHECQADRDERDHCDEDGERDGQSSDLVDPVDLRRKRRQDRPTEHRRLPLRTDLRVTVGTRRQRHDEVPTATVGCQTVEGGRGERRSIGDRCGIRDAREHRLADDPERLRTLAGGDAHGVPDLAVDGGEGVGPERDLMQAARRPTTTISGSTVPRN